MGRDLLTRLPYMIAAFLPALTFHEWAHGIVAHWFGDDTAKRQGRLTLNPAAHLDPLGTLAILLIGFGWAKPVPVDARNFKHSWAEFWVASAGPIMNIILAIVFALLYRFGAAYWFGDKEASFITNILLLSVQLNLALAFFNLIPIGPLDGNHILARLLPLRTSLRFSEWNTNYGSIVLFGMIALEWVLHFGVLSLLVGIPVHMVQNFLLG